MERRNATAKSPVSFSTVDDMVISVDTARGRLGSAIKHGFNKERPVLIEALPSIGKSRGIVEWAAETGKPLTVFTARHELFDQYAGWCENHGLRFRVLPSSYTDCETANGDYGKKWAERVKNEYRERGLLPGELHRQAEELFGELLPCQQEGNCSYFSARDFDPDEYDVLIGHYRHAHVPKRVDGRYVAFDEFPEGEFLDEFSANRVTTAIRAYLDRHDGLPFAYLKDLKEFRRDPDRKQDGITWFNRYNPTLKRDVASAVEDKTGNAHPDAAVLTYVILVANDLDNRWEFARLPDGRTAVLNPKDNSLTVLTRPLLDGAESVIALDGTPTVAKWKLMLGDHLEHQPVLTNEEKQNYLRDTLGIRVIQTTEAANHYSGRSAISVTPEQDFVLFEAVRLRENVRPALIASKSALREYREHGLTEIVEETENYGNLKGSNKFGTTRVGIVAGSPHYGDEYIQKWAALAGKSATRVEATKGMEQDFGSFGNQILRGMRENEVLQAIMRFGRDQGGATVYVHTAALPQWVERTAIVSEIRPWSKGMNEVLAAIRRLDRSEWRTKDIAKQVTISEQQTRTHLNSLHKFGYVERQRVGRGYTWSDKALSKIGQRGHVEFAQRSGAA